MPTPVRAFRPKAHQFNSFVGLVSTMSAMESSFLRSFFGHAILMQLICHTKAKLTEQEVLIHAKQKPSSSKKLDYFPLQRLSYQRHPTLHQRHPTLHQRHPTLRQRHPTLRQRQPTLRQRQPTLRQRQPTLRQRQPTLRQRQPTLRQRHPTLHQRQPTLRQRHHRPYRKCPILTGICC